MAHCELACIVSARMATDQGPVVLSALLRGELVRLRREQDLTQEQVAGELEWSVSKLIRIEGGRSSITKVDLDALLNMYGVSSREQRDHLHALNRGARERPWWARYRKQLHPTYLRYIDYEAGAVAIRQFQNLALPGLLQTSDYAREVSIATGADPKKLDVVVESRLRRQSELAKRVPRPRQSFVLDEAVIRRHVGIGTDPNIMPEQLRQIVARMQNSDIIAVRILPFSAGAHAAMGSPFTLLEFEGSLADMVFLDTQTRGMLALSSVEDPDMGVYAEIFESLRVQSLSVSESIELILGIADGMSLRERPYDGS
jgi:transcriptional regulator with XRE-family HTH domain